MMEKETVVETRATNSTFTWEKALARIVTQQTFRAELGYNVIKGTEHFVSLKTSVVITE
jgi:hypothetical protein